MKDWESKKNAFITEINSVIFPILVVAEKDRKTFEVKLGKTKYAMMDQVVTEPAMTDLIDRLGKKCFGENPKYNNTHRVFWFSTVGLYE